jgi:hypothetical protein
MYGGPVVIWASRVGRRVVIKKGNGFLSESEKVKLGIGLLFGVRN